MEHWVCFEVCKLIWKFSPLFQATSHRSSGGSCPSWREELDRINESSAYGVGWCEFRSLFMENLNSLCILRFSGDRRTLHLFLATGSSLDVFQAVPGTMASIWSIASHCGNAIFCGTVDLMRKVSFLGDTAEVAGTTTIAWTCWQIRFSTISTALAEAVLGDGFSVPYRRWSNAWTAVFEVSLAHFY